MNTGKDSCWQDVSCLELDDSEEVFRVERDSEQFRILTQEIRTIWLTCTDSNRKAMSVFFRLLCDETDKSLYTHREIVAIVDSKNRQASSQHMEDFCACGKDMFLFLKA